MMQFHQKESFITNFNVLSLRLYEAAIHKFNEKYPEIKIWTEEKSFDSLGRPMRDYSLHTLEGYKQRRKWNRFFKSVNKQKLMDGKI
jgi:hypothetical protein